MRAGEESRPGGDRQAVQGPGLAAVDVLILCGGMGTRLREAVPDLPKGLAPIGGTPFLDILVERLVRQGSRRIVFCVGHRKEQIIERYAARADVECAFSTEDAPLGTGGAVLNAMKLVRSATVLVMNGDSLCDVDLRAFHEFHATRGGAMSIVVGEPRGRDDGGQVRLDDSGRIESFAEKGPAGEPGGYINAGVYLIERDALGADGRPPPLSLEYDVFPQLVRAQPCYAHVVPGGVLDIGTPERYAQANRDLPR